MPRKRHPLLALRTLASLAALSLSTAPAMLAQAPHSNTAGEANLLIPNLSQATFFGGLVDGQSLLLYSFIFVALGLVFGLVMYRKLRNLPVHRAMLEVSELIYETCKTYLVQQAKFLVILEIFVGIIIILYFGVLEHYDAFRVFIILLFSVIGICGSSGVAWFGIRVNTFANSRAAFASLGGAPFPCHDIPLKAGMSIGMLLVSVELALLLIILLFVPRDYSGACFVGFAIGESLGAAALRVAGGIFTK
ncbi:MAG: sodium/proton-translocating pyrophosphatase, partial [Bryobacteraceae bacterium]